MMPAGQMPGGSPGPMGGGGPPQGGGPGEGNMQMKNQLVILLTKAREMAEANGLDWKEIISEIDSKNIKSDVPLPKPPSPDRP